ISSHLFTLIKTIKFLCLKLRVFFQMNLLQNQRRKPKVWAFNRASEWWDVVVPGFTDAQWLQNFRMSEQTFIYLCNKLCPALERQHTTFCHFAFSLNKLPLKKRVAIALWKLATGSEYRSVGHLFGVSIKTVCSCVQEFCAAAKTVLVPEQIRLPDEDRFREIAMYIKNRWGLPQCVGAIDGCHIPIIAPQHYHTVYFNRKGWHSIILQAVVDGKGIFWNLFAGLSGNSHDARVFRLSALSELASRGNLFPPHIRNIGTVATGYYILGDSAYSLLDWLLKPFPDTGRLTSEQQFFNKKMCSAGVVVENAFGRLKGRWRCRLKRNDCNVELVKSMVLTCCALHNLCENHGESFETSLDLPDAEAAALQPGQGLPRDLDEGRRVRDALMEDSFRLTN
uniref:DDE Tnp4 domain-containing protein n=1 Tax=Kryptolebias marmoratus TaxID=37003 RepID=A0A3Q3FP78_KRYMA